MTGLAAVSCTQCGGAVHAAPGKPLPECLFCGAEASDLVAFDPPDHEPLTEAVPFSVSDEAAREGFAGFARSSFWHPRALREATLELRRVVLPAWAFVGHVESHWTGVAPAATRSGKRPRAGVDQRTIEVLVPASATLSQAELTQLGGFGTQVAPLHNEDPLEVSELSQAAARSRAYEEIRRRHAAAIQTDEGVSAVRVASLVEDLSARHVGVPVYVGTYTMGEHRYRVLVNGKTGELHARVPFAWRKALAMVAVGLGALFVLALVVSAL